MDSLGDFVLADVDQHQDSAEEQARGVRHILAGAARGGAVNRFEHGALAADVGGTGEADGAGDLRGDVGEHVAIEVGHDDDVEGFGGVGHFGRADVDDPVFLFNRRIFGGDFVEDFVEEAVGHLHDVVLGEAGDLFAVELAWRIRRRSGRFFRSRGGR